MKVSLLGILYIFTVCWALPELQIEVLKKPDDCSKVSAEKDLVYIHHKSFYGNGTMYESSYERGQPVYLPLGRRKIIPGLNDALIGMCVGEVRRVVVPPHLGYGAYGFKSEIYVIPPDETLIFEVEMVLFNDARVVGQAFATLDTNSDDVLDMDEVSILTSSFQHLPENIFKKKLNEEEVTEMFTQMFDETDTDKDGVISLDEFMTATALQDPSMSMQGNTQDRGPEDGEGEKKKTEL